MQLLPFSFSRSLYSAGCTAVVARGQVCAYILWERVIFQTSFVYSNFVVAERKTETFEQCTRRPDFRRVFCIQTNKKKRNRRSFDGGHLFIANSFIAIHGEDLTLRKEKNGINRKEVSFVYPRARCLSSGDAAAVSDNRIKYRSI